jgi:hypothetical protein
VRLSDLADLVLDHSTFERLLDLLGRALSASAGRDGSRRAVAADGLTSLILHESDDLSYVRLETSHGGFQTPDFVVSIEAPRAFPDTVRASRGVRAGPEVPSNEAGEAGEREAAG